MAGRAAEISQRAMRVNMRLITTANTHDAKPRQTDHPALTKMTDRATGQR